MPRKGDVVRGYKILKKIGRGGFGDVFLIEEVLPPHGQYALKIVENDVALNEEIKVGLMLSQKCPFLVKFKETFVEEEELYIVMEYCGGGDLESRCKQNLPLDDMDIYRFVYESSMAIKTIHNANMIHRDIKLSNFFLKINGSFMLGDFGMARTLDSGSARTMTRVGAEGFVCPEILKGEKVYTNKADIFSWGVTLLQIILGFNPFANMHGIVNMELVMKGKPVDAVLQHKHPLIPLALRMISLDPALRPSVEEVLGFEFAALPLLYVSLRERNEKDEAKEEKESETERQLANERDAALEEVKKLRRERDDALEENRKLKEKEKRNTSDILVTFRPDLEDRYQLVQAQVVGQQVCLFKGEGDRAITVYENTAIAEGIYCLTVKIKYRSRDVSMFKFRAIPPALLDRMDDSQWAVWGEPPGAPGLFFRSEDDKHSYIRMYATVDEPDYSTDDNSVPDNSLVAVEMDCRQRTLSFFINGKKVPHAVSGIRLPMHFGITGFGGQSFTCTSFRRLDSPTPSAVTCKFYPSTF